VKTDRRGDVVCTKQASIWVPHDARKPMRDLIRARATAVRGARPDAPASAGISPAAWPELFWQEGLDRRLPARWLARVRFDHSAQRVVLQYTFTPSRTPTRVSSASPCRRGGEAMRGVGLIKAVTVVYEVGDF
jgi:transposase